MDYFRGFRPPSAFAQEYLFFSDGMGHMRSEDFWIDRNKFKNNLIMVVLGGALHVQQGGHWALQKGDGILMRLTQQHAYYTDPQDTAELVWLHLGGKRCESYLSLLEQTHPLPLAFQIPRVKELIFQCLTAYNEPPDQTEFRVSEILYSILLSIVQATCRQSETVDEMQKFRNQAERFVEENLYASVSLEDFAAHFSISKYHFCRLFKAAFSLTPIAYILKRKIEFSKYLLAYTGDSVAAIASALGFADQSHFSKTFSRFEKESPTDFRRRGV